MGRNACVVRRVVPRVRLANHSNSNKGVFYLPREEVSEHVARSHVRAPSGWPRGAGVQGIQGFVPCVPRAGPRV